MTENTPYRGYIGTLATAVLFGTFMAKVSHNTWSKLVQLRATHWNLTFSASLKRKKNHNAVALKRTHIPFEHMPPLVGLSIGA